ncbi:FKBP9_10 [Mytilus edulis]|uniref:FKBP9_10 n=1 Tax=Mytilus edulis TaxID=6550 RepID=A0A8S3QG19_MYTED|nr:FKBP9_10 [Mytilus edulis]
MDKQKKSVVPTNDFHDCRCYNASPSTTFELLEGREEDTGIIDGIVESVSFESNIIEVEDEYFNIPKNMLMAVFPSGQFVQNTNIRAKRRREEVIEIDDVIFIKFYENGSLLDGSYFQRQTRTTALFEFIGRQDVYLEGPALSLMPECSHKKLDKIFKNASDIISDTGHDTRSKD